MVMSRQRNIPNRENCSEKELDTATSAAPTLKSHKSPMAMKALFMGLNHERLAEVFAVNQDSVSVGCDVLINEASMGLSKDLVQDVPP